MKLYLYTNELYLKANTCYICEQPLTKENYKLTDLVT